MWGQSRHCPVPADILFFVFYGVLLVICGSYLNVVLGILVVLLTYICSSVSSKNNTEIIDILYDIVVSGTCVSVILQSYAFTLESNPGIFVSRREIGSCPIITRHSIEGVSGIKATEPCGLSSYKVVPLERQYAFSPNDRRTLMVADGLGARVLRCVDVGVYCFDWSISIEGHEYIPTLDMMHAMYAENAKRVFHVSLGAHMYKDAKAKHTEDKRIAFAGKNANQTIYFPHATQELVLLPYESAKETRSISVIEQIGTAPTHGDFLVLLLNDMLIHKTNPPRIFFASSRLCDRKSQYCSYITRHPDEPLALLAKCSSATWFSIISIVTRCEDTIDTVCSQNVQTQVLIFFINIVCDVIVLYMASALPRRLARRPILPIFFIVSALFTLDWVSIVFVMHNGNRRPHSAVLHIAMMLLQVAHISAIVWQLIHIDLFAGTHLYVYRQYEHVPWILIFLAPCAIFQGCIYVISLSHSLSIACVLLANEVSKFPFAATERGAIL